MAIAAAIDVCPIVTAAAAVYTGAVNITADVLVMRPTIAVVVAVQVVRVTTEEAEEIWPVVTAAAALQVVRVTTEAADEM